MQGPIHMKRQLSHNEMKSRRPVVDTTGNIDPPPPKYFFSGGSQKSCPRLSPQRFSPRLQGSPPMVGIYTFATKLE
jgi:hypothetical protein